MIAADSKSLSSKQAPAPPALGWPGALWRVAVSALLVAGYFWAREPIRQWAVGAYSRISDQPMEPSTPRVFEILALLVALVITWRKIVLGDPRFHAPLLATTILLVGDAGFNILETHPAPQWLESLFGGIVSDYSPSVLAIVTTIVAEIFLGRFFWGKWPHLASAYISGISVGILIKSPALWPYIACGLIAITSKYVLRIGNRHLWNPTNFGVTMMLFLAWNDVASLSFQAGNNGWAVAAIWLLGGLIMYRLGRFHIPLAFVLTWAPLAFVRSGITGQTWQMEMAPITTPMFQLYIFFMITDPKTTTHGWRRQTVVAVLVAVAETMLRLTLKDVHSLYHALFIVGPISNLVEIIALRRSKTVLSGIPATEPNPAAISPSSSAPVTATRPSSVV